MNHAAAPSHIQSANPSAYGESPSAVGHVVFTTSSSSSLFVAAWTPQSAGAYAGTCLFLIVLAALFRGLHAGKHVLEARWLDRKLDRPVIVPGEKSRANAVRGDRHATRHHRVADGQSDEAAGAVRWCARGVMPWRWSVDVLRATFTLVLTAVSYLL